MIDLYTYIKTLRPFLIGSSRLSFLDVGLWMYMEVDIASQSVFSVSSLVIEFHVVLLRIDMFSGQYHSPVQFDDETGYHCLLSAGR
jgi:hypothetical protein